MTSGRRIDWQKYIIPNYVIPKLNDWSSEGIVPIVRGTFYELVSTKVIDNTQTQYKQLDKALVTARKNGLLKVDCFADHDLQKTDG